MDESIEFVLPFGVQSDFKTFRKGRMHVCTTGDELSVQQTEGAGMNPRYRDIALLARVIDCIEGVSEVTVDVLKELYEPDFIFLQLLFQQLNGNLQTSFNATCPECQSIFPVSVGRLYEDMSVYGSTSSDNVKLRTQFKFLLPLNKKQMDGKVSGVMRLVKVKDLLDVERDSMVQKDSSYYYVVLLSKCIVQLGENKNVTRRTIENLSPFQFAFLVDFMNQVNHMVIKKVPLHCACCGNKYTGTFMQLGEA